MSVIATQQFNNREPDSVHSVRQRSVWLESGICLSLACLMLLAQSQTRVLSETTRNSISLWQTQVLQRRVLWQQQVQQLTALVLVRHQQSSSETAQQSTNSLQAQLDQVRVENEALRSSLDLSLTQRTNQTATTAPVISLSQRLIEFPQHHQPSLNQIVMSSQGVLGWIDQVNGQRAHVLLLQDNPSLRLAVTTQSGASGLLVNKRGTLVLTEVPTTLPLHPGDVVVTMNQLAVPGGLPIGVIQKVSIEESGVIQEAVVQPNHYFGEEALVHVGE